MITASVFIMLKIQSLCVMTCRASRPLSAARRSRISLSFTAVLFLLDSFLPRPHRGRASDVYTRG